MHLTNCVVLSWSWRYVIFADKANPVDGGALSPVRPAQGILPA
jgi:hypothetical protein